MTIKLSVFKKIGFIFVFISIIAALILSLKSIDNSIWIVIAILILNIIIALDNLKERKTFFLFNVTFFTFLLSMLFIKAIEGTELLKGYSEKTKELVFVGLVLSLIFITVGMLFGQRHKRKSTGFGDVSECLTEEEYLNIHSRAITFVFILYFITYPFSLLYVLERASYVSTTSYLSYYVSFVSSIPYIFIKIGELNQILFCVLFCLEYRKKRLILPTVLFIFQSVVSLGIGQRNIFVLDILMFIVLIGFANRKSIKYRNSPLYTKRYIIFAIFALPLLIVFLDYWGNARMGVSGSEGLFEGFKNFFSKQGEQINFFADTIERKNEIWKQPVPYTFAAPYNYIRNLFGLKNYGTYTVENALYGNSLAATQFYITSPGSLVSGKGSGCCFLSELYFDFGLPGIVLGSAFLGYVIGQLALKDTKEYWLNAFVALMIRNIIYIPRSSYFDWIASPFNIWNLFIVFLIYLFVSKGRLRLSFRK